MAQNALDHRGLLDERDEAQAPTTARARQNVEAEAATHEISPTWRRRPRRSHSAPRWRDRCVGLGGAGLGGARGLLGRWRVGGVGLARAGQGGPTRSRPTVGADGATLAPSWASLAAGGPSLRGVRRPCWPASAPRRSSPSPRTARRRTVARSATAQAVGYRGNPLVGDSVPTGSDNHAHKWQHRWALEAHNLASGGTPSEALATRVRFYGRDDCCSVATFRRPCSPRPSASPVPSPGRRTAHKRWRRHADLRGSALR